MEDIQNLLCYVAYDFSVLVIQHWPDVCYRFERLGTLLCLLVIRWKECFFRGCESLFDLGTAALFVIIWSFFLSLTSMSILLYLIIFTGAAVCAVHYLGYTPGLLIVGLFTILVLRIYANFFIAGPLLIVGGVLFSFNHTRLVVLVATVYEIYYAKHQIGWSGVLISINLAFLSCDALICIDEWGDDFRKTDQFKEPTVPQSFVEQEILAESKFCVHADKFEQVGACKVSTKPEAITTFMKKQKKSSIISISVVKRGRNATNEMKRIVACVDHYETLGFSRYNKIDATLLKKEYKKKAMLVHPDKNMGSSLADESFKKVQCAYEVLSNYLKKREYDEQLRNEDSKSLSHTSASTNYCSDDLKHIQCTKCGNIHIWICTNRTRLKARWCQDCCQYHQARDGDGWVEYNGSFGSNLSRKIEIPQAFVCAQSKIFDVSEWAICQGMACRPNTHRPSFHVSMVGVDTTQKCGSSRCPWGSKMTDDEEDEFDLWLQQALASGLFREASKHRKSWTRFKFAPKKVKKQWARMSRWSH
ncbi:uncharacterized protein [Rutidosis leptorrhynchoides]|uniref:uncharacterized protein n=1 Tax=Rutidosis leptorrhynchoides TaxID=125765 RepID=UPI003A99EFA8